MIVECYLNIVSLVMLKKFLREKRIRLASDSILYRLNEVNINMNISPIPETADIAQLSTTQQRQRQQRSIILNSAKHSVMMVTGLCFISVLNHLVLFFVVLVLHFYGQTLIYFYTLFVSFFLLTLKYVLDFFIFFFFNKNFRSVCLKYLKFK